MGTLEDKIAEYERRAEELNKVADGMADVEAAKLLRTVGAQYVRMAHWLLQSERIFVNLDDVIKPEGEAPPKA